MNCNKFRILLSAYIDGELPEQEKALLTDHLMGCGECGKTRGDLLYLKDLFSKSPGSALPQDFENRIREKIRAEGISFRRKILLPSLRWAAAACFLFLAAAGAMRFSRHAGVRNS